MTAPRTTRPLRAEIARALPDRPFSIDLWDGTSIEATSPGPRFAVTSPAAVAHLLRSPGQLGLGRAYVAGMIVPDDLDAVVERLLRWSPSAPISPRQRARFMAAALAAIGPMRPPPIPAAELAPARRRHTLLRDRRAVQHHYDLSNEFFALFLDASMTYSCAIFSHGATTLEEAQTEKLDLVCRKLALQPGERLLDVGCGWGAFALHAASHYDVEVVGITLAEEQAALARRRVEDAGLSGRIDIRVADYREVRDEPFDAVASIGMVEHVGSEQIDGYAERLAALLRPGGRLLNHGIARLRHSDPPAGPFSERYVFADAEPLHLSRIQLALERAGFAVDHVEGFAPDYAETLRHWAERLDANLEEAERLVGPERVRVWRLYLRAARNGFRIGFTSVYQVRAALRG